MPGPKVASSVRAVGFIQGASEATKKALLGILSEDTSSDAFMAVTFFRDANSETARAVLDIAIAAVKEREGPSPQQKGADKRRKNAVETKADPADVSTTNKKGGK